jgi:hypothetical protein
MSFIALRCSAQARLARMADEVDTFRTQIVTRRAEEFRDLKVSQLPSSVRRRRFSVACIAASFNAQSCRPSALPIAVVIAN